MRFQLITILLLGPAVLLLVCGCGQSGAASTQPADEHNVAQQASSSQSGAQLWAENCSRCHNIRPPQSFSDAQWEAVVMHMRLRANLTGNEQRKITEFLQASH
jgi:hypothetical protein